MLTTVRIEVIGTVTLSVQSHTESDWSAPRYSLQRFTRHGDGSISQRTEYGVDGFASIEEALEFGREWCQTGNGKDASVG